MGKHEVALYGQDKYGEINLRKIVFIGYLDIFSEKKAIKIWMVLKKAIPLQRIKKNIAEWSSW